MTLRNRQCRLLSAVMLGTLNAIAAFQSPPVSLVARSPISTAISCSRLRMSSVLEDAPPTARVEEEASSSTGTQSNLPPLIQKMADERREFELNLGKAMDTLRKDYPHILYKTPDFSIYHDDISVVDPSGVQLTGLTNYKHSFAFFQTIAKFFYNLNPGMSGIQYRMVYDFARSSIRISWNVMLVPRVVGNRRNALYIDGISLYKLDAKSGKIVEHKVENMLINNRPVVPPYGILTILSEELMARRKPVGVPVGVGALVVPETSLS